MADENGMQANVGAVGGPGGSMNPVGIQTPMYQGPQVRHPGEVSMDLVQATQTQMQATLQTAMITRPNALNSMGMMGGAFGPMGSVNPASPVGSYAQQYQSNMAQINAQAINPMTASFMTGGSGFQPGMMPSPSMMTPPSMGIYRPFPQQPSPSISPHPYQPLFPTPFSPPILSPQFAPPMDFNLGIAQQRIAQNTGAALALPGTIARLGVDYAGSQIGAGVGARVGAHLGPMGARYGAIGGAIGGLALSEMGGFGRAAEGIMDNVVPFHRLAQRAAQVRSISQGFVVGGADMDVSGVGFTRRASTHLARGLEDLASNREFRHDTDNRFNAADLTRMTRSAAQNGMMEDVSSPEEVIGRVKNIAKSLRTFMKIANEPDIREALKQMGQMNAMGMSLPETMQIMHNARGYARMAGTTVKGIMESGLAGAATFQSHGLTAGLGMDVGMGSMAIARQMAGSGSMDPRQLALLGGVSGMAQREMQMQAATLKMPMMAAAMSTSLPGGAFGVNSGNVHALLGGKLNIGDMAGMGAGNLADAVAKHGVGALGMFQMQQSELQDQLGRTLGPMGMKVMQMRQVMNTQKMLGINGPGGFVTAAQAMGMDPDQARQMASQASSPEFFQNMRRQFHAQIMDQRADAYEEHKRSRASLLDVTFGEGARGVRSAMSRVGESFRDMQEGVVNLFTTSPEEKAARANGQVLMRTPSSLLASGETQERMIRGSSSRSVDRLAMAAQRLMAGHEGEGAMFHNADGHGIGYNSVTGWLKDIQGGDADDLRQMRLREGGLKGKLGGGFLEGVGRFLTGGAGFANEDEIRGRNQRANKSSERIYSGLTATEDQRGSAMKRLTGQLGDKAGEFKSRFQANLAKRARAGASMLGPGKGAEGDEEEVLQQTAAEMGIKGPININDVMTASTGMAKTLADTAGSGFFSMQRSEDMGKFKEGVRTAEMIQNDVGEKVFGRKSDSAMDKKALDLIFGRYKEPEFGAYAALIASESHQAVGDFRNQVLKSKGEKFVERMETAAQGIIKEATEKNLMQQLKDAGRTIASKGTNMQRFAKAAANSVTDVKTMVRRNEGLKNLVKDQNLVNQSGGTNSDLLSRLAGMTSDDMKDAGVDDKVQALAKQYNEATTDDQRSAIEQKLQDLEVTNGEGTSQKRGGGFMSSLEGLTKNLMGETAGLSDEVAKSFGTSVGLFSEASQALKEAAMMMGRRQGTEFAPGVNE